MGHAHPPAAAGCRRSGWAVVGGGGSHLRRQPQPACRPAGPLPRRDSWFQAVFWAYRPRGLQEAWQGGHGCILHAIWHTPHGALQHATPLAAKVICAANAAVLHRGRRRAGRHANPQSCVPNSPKQQTGGGSQCRAPLRPDGWFTWEWRGAAVLAGGLQLPRLPGGKARSAARFLPRISRQNGHSAAAFACMEGCAVCTGATAWAGQGPTRRSRSRTGGAGGGQSQPSQAEPQPWCFTLKTVWRPSAVTQ